MPTVPDVDLVSSWNEVDAAAQAIANGVQKSQLAQSVRTSLGKADEAWARLYWVTISRSGGSYTCDKTLAEIQSAQLAGAFVRAHLPDGFEADLTNDDGGAMFYALDNSGGPMVLMRYTVAGSGVSFNSWPIGGSGSGLTEEIKQALLSCMAHVAWSDEHGQDYYDALDAALYPPSELSYISAVYTQSGTVYDDASLDSLRSDLVVTAHYADATTEVVTGYTLSGTLTEGTSTITVTYGGKTTTINVTVTERESIPSDYQEVEYIESDGNQYINTGIKPNDDYLEIDIIYHKTQVSKEEMIVGSLAAGAMAAPFGIGFTSTTNRIYAYSSTSAEVISPLTYADKVIAVAVFQSSSPTAKITISANGQSASGEKTGANSSYLPNGVLHVFSAGTLYKASGRVYSLVASNSSGEFLNLVPCYRKSDGVIGMYDKVTSTFFTNSGSGTFAKGSDIS